MAEALLHIFAVNAEVDVRHTYLSRSQGKGAALPNLAGWLGLRQGGLNSDEIEIFPLSDLAGMALSDYVATAFDILDAPLGQTAARLNALDGHVLLIPASAIAGEVKTGAELTLVASLPMAQADHSAEALEPTPVEAPPSPVEQPLDATPTRRKVPAVFIGFVLAVLLMLVAQLW